MPTWSKPLRASSLMRVSGRELSLGLNSEKTIFLFDLDGTLVDSAALHDRAFREALEMHVPSLRSAYTYKTVQGMSTREALLALGVKDERELITVANEKQLIYRMGVLRGCLQLLPGAIRLLSNLASIGHSLFLVTSGSHSSAMAALDSHNIRHFFDGIVTADKVNNGKPAPDSYVYCINIFDLPVGRCVAVEDSLNGVSAARKAGLFVMGVHNPAIAGIVDRFFPTLDDVGCWVEVAMSSRGAPS
jgi:HAD superfamily hydrolase (TIGR01509 family)